MNIDISNGIKVGGKTYRVESGETTNSKLKEASYYGRIYHTEQRILVDNSVPKQQLSNSIIHEVVHAIDDVFAIKLSESQTKRLANGLHQVLEQFNISFLAKGKSK